MSLCSCLSDAKLQPDWYGKAYNSEMVIFARIYNVKLYAFDVGLEHSCNKMHGLCHAFSSCEKFEDIMQPRDCTITVSKATLSYVSHILNC